MYGGYLALSSWNEIVYADYAGSLQMVGGQNLFTNTARRGPPQTP